MDEDNLGKSGVKDNLRCTRKVAGNRIIENKRKKAEIPPQAFLEAVF